MKELGITKGEWQHFKFAKGNVEANGRSVANCMGYSNNTDAGKHIEENYANAELVIDAGNTAQKCGLLPSELLQQRDELREALAEQKRLYFNLFDEETSCMYCEAKIRRGSAIILCKECAENTEG